MIKFLGTKGTWVEVINSCLTTVGKPEIDKEPLDKWKRRLLLSEHSPIRQLWYKWKWIDLKYWVSVHFTRHKIGIEHWVRTQRSDRTGVTRDKLSQSTVVEHECEANAQAIINISRKRLCNSASPETREAWKEVLNKIDPALSSCCVPDCIYRGYCYEFKSCGFHKTEPYRQALEIYRKGINSAE